MTSAHSGATTRTNRSTSRVVIELTIAAFGVALVVSAMAANRAWLDRHFLPSFFMPRRWYVLIETAVRVLIGAAGLFLTFGRTRLARMATHAPATTLSALVAGVMAVG